MRWCRTGLLFFGLILSSACKDDPLPTPPPPLPEGSPLIDLVSPSTGSLGALITISGTNFGAEPLAVFEVPELQISAPAQTFTSGAGQIVVMVPIGISADAKIRVWNGELASETKDFEVVALTDPTPGPAGDAIAAKLGLLVGLAGALDHELGIGLYPALVEEGYSSSATALSQVLVDIQGFLPSEATRLSAGRSPAVLAQVDAILASDAFVAVDQQLLVSTDRLSHSTLGDALRNLSTAEQELRDIDGFLANLKIGLIAAEVLLDGALAASAGIAAELIVDAIAAIEIVLPIIDLARDLLKIVLRVIDAAPTSPVIDTFRTYVSDPDPDRYLNQHFVLPPQAGSSRAAAEPSPGVAIMPLEYTLRGRIDFENQESAGLEGASVDISGELADYASLLDDIFIPHIESKDVEIALALQSCDNPAPSPGLVSPCMENGVVTGVWAPTGLVIDGIIEGRTTFVRVYPDLVEVHESSSECIAIGQTCILKSVAMIHRELKVLPRPFLGSVSPASAYIGDAVTTVAEGSPDIPTFHFDLWFTPPSNPNFGVGRATTSRTDYGGYDVVEVPDAIPGEHWFEIDNVESNRLPFTVLNPLLEHVHPSAIVDEAFPFSGRGFSHNLEHDEISIGGATLFPDAPRSSNSIGEPWVEEAHRNLHFVVPRTAQAGDGTFKVTVIEELESNAVPIAVRRFSTPITLSSGAAIGLRPDLSRADDGREIAVWIERSGPGGSNMIVASTRAAGGAQWSTPSVVAVDLGGIESAPPKPSIAIGPSGYHVAYVALEAGRDVVRYTYSNDGVSWSMPQTVSTAATSAVQPTIAAGDGGLVVVAWIEEGAEEGRAASLLWARAPAGGAFGAPQTFVRLGDAAQPALAATGNDVVLVWSESLPSADPLPARAIFGALSTDRAATFAAAVELSGVGDLAFKPSVVLKPAGACPNRVYLAFESVDGYAIGVTRWSGGPPAITAIAGALEQSQSPSIGVDGDCTPTVAWVTTGWALARNYPWVSGVHFARSFDDGATFSTPYPAVASTLGGRHAHPSIVATGRAFVTIAWQDESGVRPAIRVTTTDGAPSAPSDHPANIGVATKAEWIFRMHSLAPSVRTNGFDLRGDLYASQRDGSRLLRLTRDQLGIVARPDIADDGRFIIYGGGLGTGIRIADGDGEQPLRLTQDHDGVLATHGRWLGAGARLCYYDEYGGVRSITRFGDGNRSGCSAAPLPPTLPAGVSYTVPSPDGSWVATISQAAGGYGVLGVSDPSLAAIVPLTTLADAAFPIWSGDSSTIAFLSDRTGNVEVFVTTPLSSPGDEQNATNTGNDEIGAEFLYDGTLVVTTVAADGYGLVRAIDPFVPATETIIGRSGFVGAVDDLFLDGLEFSIDVGPRGAIIAQGGNAAATVQLLSAGYIPVVYTVESAPVGVSVVFGPSPFPGASTMTVTVDETTAPGDYPLTIRGTGPDRSRTVAFALSVTPGVPLDAGTTDSGVADSGADAGAGDAGPGPLVVACGPGSCNLVNPTDTCCTSDMGVTGTCTDVNLCFVGVRVVCDGPEDCTSNPFAPICCNQGGPYTTCSAAVACGGSSQLFCHGPADCDALRPNCCPWAPSSTLNVCQAGPC